MSVCVATGYPGEACCIRRSRVISVVRVSKVTLMKTLALFLLPFCLLAQDDGPAQAKRGRALFFETAKPQPCGTCHSVAGKGTAVGPDLKTWARIPPRAAAMAITASVTEKVVSAKPANGPEFPAMKVSEDATNVQLFDLSATPPAPRTLPKAEVKLGPNSTWRHPPGVTKPTPEELADLIAYIRWAGAKDARGVKPDDVE